MINKENLDKALQSKSYDTFGEFYGEYSTEFEKKYKSDTVNERTLFNELLVKMIQLSKSDDLPEQRLANYTNKNTDMRNYFVEQLFKDPNPAKNEKDFIRLLSRLADHCAGTTLKEALKNDPEYGIGNQASDAYYQDTQSFYDQVVEKARENNWNESFIDKIRESSPQATEAKKAQNRM